jgi:alkyl hydroperoxide reductase subunit D
MALEELKALLPDFAKDIRLNLSTLAGEEELTDQQKWGCFLSCAIATRDKVLARHIAEETDGKLTAEAKQAAYAAATIMGMNNVYYRFVHLETKGEFQSMPAKLRMNVIGSPGVDKVDFELWSLAVSALNGCGMCIDAHVDQLVKHGMDKTKIQTAVRIGAVINAAANALHAADIASAA